MENQAIFLNILFISSQFGDYILGISETSFTFSIITDIQTTAKMYTKDKKSPKQTETKQKQEIKRNKPSHFYGLVAQILYSCLRGSCTAEKITGLF